MNIAILCYIFRLTKANQNLISGTQLQMSLLVIIKLTNCNQNYQTSVSINTH